MSERAPRIGFQLVCLAYLLGELWLIYRIPNAVTSPLDIRAAELADAERLGKLLAGIGLALLVMRLSSLSRTPTWIAAFAILSGLGVVLMSTVIQPKILDYLTSMASGEERQRAIAQRYIVLAASSGEPVGLQSLGLDSKSLNPQQTYALITLPFLRWSDQTWQATLDAVPGLQVKLGTVKCTQRKGARCDCKSADDTIQRRLDAMVYAFGDDRYEVDCIRTLEATALQGSKMKQEVIRLKLNLAGQRYQTRENALRQANREFNYLLLAKPETFEKSGKNAKQGSDAYRALISPAIALFLCSFFFVLNACSLFLSMCQRLLPSAPVIVVLVSNIALPLVVFASLLATPNPRILAHTELAAQSELGIMKKFGRAIVLDAGPRLYTLSSYIFGPELPSP